MSIRKKLLISNFGMVFIPLFLFFVAAVLLLGLFQRDIAGISDIYPNSTFRRERGSISGRVTKSGRGVLGAHVVAFNPSTGRMVGGFTLSEDGRFVIGGLEPGPYVLRVEPLDDGDIESFFDLTLNIDADFRAKFHDKVVVVPRGGGANGITITVEPKR